MLTNNKNEIRNAVKSIIVKDKKQKEAKIINAILNLPSFLNAKSVGLFMALKNEPNLKQVLEHCILNGKQALLPVTEKEIKFALITNQTAFAKKRFGVLEPKHPLFAGGMPEIIFVPMVAYDKNLNRLGHGAGYYDRLLKGRNVLKIGVSFSDFEVCEVPCDFNDVKMDIIINDKGVLCA